MILVEPIRVIELSDSLIYRFTVSVSVSAVPVISKGLSQSVIVQVGLWLEVEEYLQLHFHIRLEYLLLLHYSL